MTPSEAVAVMLGIFKTYWDTTAYAANVVYDDVPAPNPLPNAPWARAYVQHYGRRQASLTGATGLIRYDNRGTIWVQIFTPMGAGKALARTLAEGVVNAFEDARTEVWFRNTRMSEAGQDGAYTQVNVASEFNYDTVR